MACQIVEDASASALVSAISITIECWMASVVVAIILAVLDICRRKLSLLLIATLLLAGFDYKWMTYAINACGVIVNVEVSWALMIVLAGFLIYRLSEMTRRERRN